MYIVLNNSFGGNNGTPLGQYAYTKRNLLIRRRLTEAQ